MGTGTFLDGLYKSLNVTREQAGVKLPTDPEPKIATPPRPSTPQASKRQPTPPRPITVAPEPQDRSSGPSHVESPAGAPAISKGQSLTGEAQAPAKRQSVPAMRPAASKPERTIPKAKAGTPASAAPPATFSSFIADGKPKVRLPGDNRLLSDVASELGSHLAGVLYRHTGEVVEYRDGLLHSISAQQLRTRAERYVTFYRVRSLNQSYVDVGASLNEGDARGILVSQQFLEHLKSIRHVNTVRLPVLRPGGKIELLPEGYDRETETFTDAQVDYSEDVTFESAKAELQDLFGEFRFADGERSRSVAVSALVGLYAKQLLRPGELRPAFTYLKNAEGSGATTCAACAIVPLLGALPIGSKARDDDEMRKSLTSAIRTGQEVIFLDNLRGQLNSPALEAFVTAPTWTDRLLGANEVFTGQNNTTVFITSNGLTITPDWRRRSLFIELHLSEERAEDKIFARPLSIPILMGLRPKILASCWALVKHWDEQGRPGPSRSHSAFPAWAATIGGIVECAGFGCALQTANVAIVADEDGQNMRQLVAAMTPSTAYTSSELVTLCRRINAFDGLVGSTDADMGRAQRTAFGRLIARYDDRRVGDLRFHITGTGHAKRFRALQASDIEEQAARETNVEAEAESSPLKTTPDESTPRTGGKDVEL